MQMYKKIPPSSICLKKGLEKDGGDLLSRYTQYHRRGWA